MEKELSTKEARTYEQHPAFSTHMAVSLLFKPMETEKDINTFTAQ